MPSQSNTTPSVVARVLPARPLILFLSLQVLDVLTTIVGLHYGAQEGSGYIGHLLQTGPLSGLIISKIIAAGLAAIAVFLNRKRILVFLNFWFTAVVGWNLLAIWMLRAS